MSENLPHRLSMLPKSGGYVVPFFVAWIDGKPDFRVIRPGVIAECHNYKICWLCGGPLGAYKAFVVGPMCAINRTSSEPPSHKDCAIYAAMTCPFMVNPERVRRESNLPGDRSDPAGIHLDRNPGVSLVWITKSYKPFRAGDGVLFSMGTPEERLWFARGRQATVSEIAHSINTGIPLLMKLAEEDGPDAVEALTKLQAALLEELPKEAPSGA